VIALVVVFLIGLVLISVPGRAPSAPSRRSSASAFVLPGEAIVRGDENGKFPVHLMADIILIIWLVIAIVQNVKRGTIAIFFRRWGPAVSVGSGG
jgi:hypothetical protein